jgi:hypothetical protein
LRYFNYGDTNGTNYQGGQKEEASGACSCHSGAFRTAVPQSSDQDKKYPDRGEIDEYNEHDISSAGPHGKHTSEIQISHSPKSHTNDEIAGAACAVLAGLVHKSSFSGIATLKEIHFLDDTFFDGAVEFLVGEFDALAGDA